jgi:hypothetical protein
LGKERLKMDELTVLQEVTLDYVVFYFVNRLKMPTVRHLARCYEISVAAAQLRLKSLKKKVPDTEGPESFWSGNINTWHCKMKLFSCA